MPIGSRSVTSAGPEDVITVVAEAFYRARNRGHNP
jgi:hypothetical protein